MKEWEGAHAVPRGKLRRNLSICRRKGESPALKVTETGFSPTSSLGSWTSAMTRGRPAASPRPLGSENGSRIEASAIVPPSSVSFSSGSWPLCHLSKPGGRLTPPPGIKGSKDEGSKHRPHEPPRTARTWPATKLLLTLKTVPVLKTTRRSGRPSR